MRKTTLLLASVCMMSALTAEAEVLLNFHSPVAGGPVHQEHLTTESVLRFGPGAISLVTPGQEGIALAYGDVARITFSSGMSGICAVTRPSEGFGLVNNVVSSYLDITVPADFSRADLTVTSVGGRTAIRETGWTGGSLDISTLTPGLYLITINSQTLKFIKK